jgi:hypothetical protein
MLAGMEGGPSMPFAYESQRYRLDYPDAARPISVPAVRS